MRKRSEAVAVDPRQTSIPGTTIPSPPPSTHPDELPPGCEVQDNVFFIKCPDCGMHQGYLMAKKDEAGRARCFRCERPFDECITAEFVAEARARWKASNPVKKGNAAPPPKAEEKEPEPAPPPANTKASGSPPPRCPKCGEKITTTALGEFYPCGHGPQTNNAPPAPKSSPGGKTAPAPAPAPKVDVKQDFKDHDPDKVTRAIQGFNGERVIAHYGRELFQPKQFNSFEVGPFQFETVVRPGETPFQALARANDELAKFAAIEFKRKAEDYIRRLEQIVGMVK